MLFSKSSSQTGFYKRKKKIHINFIFYKNKDEIETNKQKTSGLKYMQYQLHN